MAIEWQRVTEGAELWRRSLFADRLSIIDRIYREISKEVSAEKKGT